MALRASYLCAAAGLALLALHFNAELFAGWTRGMALWSGALGLAGVALAAWSLGGRWLSLSQWPGQVALGLNAILSLGFLFYANPA
jgi:hypothetical protein